MRLQHSPALLYYGDDIMQNIIADFTAKNCDTMRLKGLTQWDYGRVLEIKLENMPETFEAHFSYKGFDDALIVEVTPENGIATIPIPNIITTQDKDATCWIYYEDETSGATYKTIILSITPRTKPHDYVYTETEVFNYKIFKKDLEAKIAMAGKVKTVNGIEPDENGNVNLSFLGESVCIHFTELDLSTALVDIDLYQTIDDNLKKHITVEFEYLGGDKEYHHGVLIEDNRNLGLFKVRLYNTNVSGTRVFYVFKDEDSKNEYYS